MNLPAASRVVSGVVYAAGGFGIMALAAAALAPLFAAEWQQKAGRRLAAAPKP